MEAIQLYRIIDLYNIYGVDATVEIIHSYVSTHYHSYKYMLSLRWRRQICSDVKFETPRTWLICRNINNDRSVQQL